MRRGALSGRAAGGNVADGTVAQGAVTVAATVVRVDPKKRLVTLEAPDGRRVTARVHARVKDLERLRAGDTVSATYYESLAYDVRTPGAAAAGATPRRRRSPARVDTRAVTVTSRIAAVDRPAGTLTLQAPDADPVTVRIKDPAALARGEGRRPRRRHADRGSGGGHRRSEVAALRRVVRRGALLSVDKPHRSTTEGGVTKIRPSVSA